MASYDMVSPLGPLSIAPSNFFSAVFTDRGFLSFRSVSQVSFRAVIVPEPASLTLEAVGGLVLLAAAGRRGVLGLGSLSEIPLPDHLAM